MRAIGFRANGGPEVLEAVEVARPEPGPGQVLLRVAYAGVNFAEIQHRRGEFGADDGVAVPGLEAAGEIVAVGADVTGLRIGEPVAAYLPAFGGYAEFVVAEAVLTHPLRTTQGEVDPAQAAGLPCVFPTAYGLLHDTARLRAGETVLIHAAAGGIGATAVQLARSLGAAAVHGTVGSPDKVAYARELGYDEVFVRDGFGAAMLAATGGRGVDVVLDPVGGPVRQESLGVLAPFGRVAVYGDVGRHDDWTASVWDLWKRNQTIAGFNIGDLARRAPELIGRYLREGLERVAAGTLRSNVTVIHPLAEAATVHELVESGAGRGKILLSLT
ncbi:zinc-binding dehydrogenase [Streptosporangium sp. NPDC051023]|uniref:quinone oxidoreductase family protein n=1 Tax=Streptosporangium sp. NPDC051023 TaxID=3155410 RepID=UPI00345077C1